MYFDFFLYFRLVFRNLIIKTACKLENLLGAFVKYDGSESGFKFCKTSSRMYENVNVKIL